MALGGGKTFNLAPIQQRQPQGVPQTGMAQGNFDPLLDLESGLQNVDGLTQDYYDLWAGLNSVLKEQQSLGIDPFDATTPEGQQLGRTIMKTVGAMKMIGDQLKTGQSIQQAMIPYIATGQAKLADGEDLSQGVTSVQGLQDQFVPQRVDPTVQEANQYYARAFEDTNDMNAANRKLSSERVRWQGIADDPNTSQANREYAQRQVQAIGMASKNINPVNPYGGGYTIPPVVIGGIEEMLKDGITGRNPAALVNTNKDIIPSSYKADMDLGVIYFDRKEGNKTRRILIHGDNSNGYGASALYNATQQGTGSKYDYPDFVLRTNGLTLTNLNFGVDENGNPVDPGNPKRRAQKNQLLDDFAASISSAANNRFDYASDWIKRVNNVGKMPTVVPVGYPSEGSAIETITPKTGFNNPRLLVKLVGGGEIEIKKDEIQDFVKAYGKDNFHLLFKDEDWNSRKVDVQETKVPPQQQPIITPQTPQQQDLSNFTFTTDGSNSFSYNDLLKYYTPDQIQQAINNGKLKAK